MVDVRLDEAVLLLGGGVFGGVAGVWDCGVMVVVGPFGEVVGELEAGGVGGGVLKVDDDELPVFVRRLEERGFLVVGADSEDVAVLGLEAGVSEKTEARGRGGLASL